MQAPSTGLNFSFFFQMISQQPLRRVFISVHKMYVASEQGNFHPLKKIGKS